MSDIVAANQLRVFIERAERLNGEKTAINQDLSELFKEMKGQGFNTKVVKAIIADRAKDQDEKSEFDAIYELYASALGMAFATRAGARKVPVEHDEDGVFPDDDTQSAPQAAQDGGAFSEVKGSARLENAVGVEPSPSTPIQPETASTPVQDAKALTVEAVATVKPEPAQEAQILRPGPVYAEPGIVTTEHTPPEPVKRHAYSHAFGEIGQNITQLRKDIHEAFGGVQEPIVKIGPSILSGWARYNVSRSMMIDYPVVQYGGADALADVIRWNLESRNLSEADLKAIAGRLVKAAPDRADEIHQLLGLEVGEDA